MPDYSRTKIYKIWSHLGDKIYIGSTTKKYLSERMSRHRADYKRWKNEKCDYTTSYALFDEYGCDNCIIGLLVAFPCVDRDEQAQLEGRYIQEYVCVNKNIAGRSTRQRKQDNREHNAEQEKKYRSANKAQIAIKFKEKYEKNKEKIKEQNSIKTKCECGSEYVRNSKIRHLRTKKHITFLNKAETLGITDV
jgi:hypothetical protein